MTVKTIACNSSIDFFNKAWDIYSDDFLSHAETIITNHNESISISENFINKYTNGVAKPLPRLRRGDTMSLLDIMCSYGVITEDELKNYSANLCINKLKKVTMSLDRKMHVRARQCLNLCFAEMLNEVSRNEESFQTIEYKLLQRCAVLFDLNTFNSLAEFDEKYQDVDLLNDMARKSPVVEGFVNKDLNKHLCKSLLVFTHALYAKAEQLCGGNLTLLSDEQHDLLVLTNHIIKHVAENELSYRILLLALPRKVSVAIAKQNGTLQGEGTAQFFFTEDGELTELAKISISVTYGVIRKLDLGQNLGEIGDKCISTAFDMLPTVSAGYNQMKNCGEEATKLINRQIHSNIEKKNAPRLLMQVLEAAEQSLGGLEKSLIERCRELSQLFERFGSMPFDEFNEQSNSIITNVTVVTTTLSPSTVKDYTTRLQSIMSANESISKLAADGVFEEIAAETDKAVELRTAFINDISNHLTEIEGKIVPIEKNPNLTDSEKVELLESEVKRLHREIARLKEQST